MNVTYIKKVLFYFKKNNVFLRIITAITAAVTIIITATIYVHCLFTICNKFIV